MFFIQETEICNFADDTTVYSYSPNFEEATVKLFSDTHLILKAWCRLEANYKFDLTTNSRQGRIILFMENLLFRLLLTLTTANL